MMVALPTDERHEYDSACWCDRCDARRRREALRAAMVADDAWLFEFGAWQASPWNAGGAKALEELQILGTNAYIGKAYHSKPPLPVRYADIAAAIAEELDDWARAAIELYYVLGVGLPTPKSYPTKFPDEIEAMIRHQAWTADDGWGDTGVARTFARAVDAGELVERPGQPRWKASADTWGRRRATAIKAIVRRVTGG